MNKTYFIQAGESGPIKIGRSGNVPLRLQQLQVGHYDKLYLLCETLLCSEKWAHDTFDSYRISHEPRLSPNAPSCEWFEPAEEIFSFIEKINIVHSHFPAAFTDEPVDLCAPWKNHCVFDQYLLDFTVFGFNTTTAIDRKCKELGITKVQYLEKLVRADMAEQIEIEKKWKRELGERSADGEVLVLDCTK